MQDRTCAHLGCTNTFVPRGQKKYCSRQCKSRQSKVDERIKRRQAMPSKCAICKNAIPGSKNAAAIYCSTQCRTKATTQRDAARRQQDSPTPADMHCARCAALVTWKPGRKYCAPCADDALREARYRCRVAYKHKLRALAVDTFDPHDIYERDAWTCSLCNQPIDQALQYPNPMSASIDHIIPVSLGGAHSATNVAAAHLVCNLRKGNRITEAAPAAAPAG